MSYINTTNSFEIAWESLNANQRKAAESIYGPIMVIAGPGTGKTQILSTRIGHILKTTDYKPENILCLTFTDAGAVAIKKRLGEIIGSTANQVNIFTFHAFSGMLMSKYPEIFNKEGWTILEELDKKKIIRELLADVPFNSPLKPQINSIDTSISNLSSFFNTFKNENYSVVEFLNAIEEDKKLELEKEKYYYTKKFKEFKAGDLKPHEWKKYTDRIEKSLEAVLLYEKYQLKLKEKKFFELQDIILKVVETFKTNENILLECQETYQFIMVDEFQDTNGSQLDIVNELCRDIEDPNLFIVGDDDQSIYRFQGANIDNIYFFYNLYLKNKSKKELIDRIIILDQNYRSTPIILQAAKSSIEQNKQRILSMVEGIELSKNIVSAHPTYQKMNFPIEIIQTKYPEDEFIAITNQINDLVHKKKVNYKDIAVLMYKNADVLEFTNYLNIKNIPFEFSRSINILESPFILNIIDLFNYIISERTHEFEQEDLLITILFCPWNKLTAFEISEFLLNYKKYKSINKETSLRAYIETIDSNNKIKQIHEIIDKLILAYSNTKFKTMYNLILDSFNIREWICTQDNKLELFQELNSLDKFISENIEKMDVFEFKDFLNIINEYQQEDISINYVKQLKNPDAIKLMTIHGSKGLEFEYVFILRNIESNKTGSNKFFIPESIAADVHKIIDKELINTEIEEKRRLFYVGITRAKKQLFLSYYTSTSTTRDKDKEVLKSTFLLEIPTIRNSKIDLSSTEDIIAIEKNIQTSEADYIEFLGANQTLALIKANIVYEHNYLDQILQDFTLSVSDLNKYLECPLKFYFEKLLGTPTSSTPQLDLGNIIHKVFEKFFKEYVLTKELPSIDQLLKLTHTELSFNKKKFSSKEYIDALEYLNTIIPKYYDTKKELWSHTNIECEKLFEGTYQGIKLKGYIDKIDHLDASRIVMTDFKTGKYSNTSKYKKFAVPIEKEEYKDIENPTKEELYGGDYWRQAVFYNILLESIDNKIILDKFVFDFIFPEKDVFYTKEILISKEDINIVSTQIVETYHNIKSKKFDGCGKEECKWCGVVIR